MRALLTAIVCLGLTACAPSAAYEQPVDDDRYDLLAVTMPPLLREDAKKCVKTMNFTRGQNAGQGEAGKKMFDVLLDFWQVVDVSFLSGDDVKSVLPYGGNPDDVASILPEGISLPMTKAHDCGVYAGGMIVKIGLMSVSDSLKAALVEDPDIFKKMGTTLEAVQAGLAEIGAKSALLSGLSTEDKVSCTAIYQSAGVSDPSVQPLISIWMNAFVDEIESGKLAPAEIKERSEYWSTLAVGGANAVISMDGYKAQATKCDSWINDAMSNQAAK